MVSDFKIQVTDLAFVFNLASLTLKQVPTCIRKPRTNIFEMSINFLHWSLFLVVLDHFSSLLTLVSTLQTNICWVFQINEHMYLLQMP